MKKLAFTVLIMAILSPFASAGDIGNIIGVDMMIGMAGGAAMGCAFATPSYMGGSQKDGTVVTGNRVKVKVVKNKVAPPFSEAEFDLVFGEGINQTMEVVELAEKLGVLEKSGSWLSWNGDQLGQGREQAEKRLKASPEMVEALSAAVRAALAAKHGGNGLGAGPVEAAVA